jgi:hypothetical protein
MLLHYTSYTLGSEAKKNNPLWKELIGYYLHILYAPLKKNNNNNNIKRLIKF